MSPLISTGCSRFLFISTDPSDRYQALSRVLGRSQVLPRKLGCLGKTSHAVIGQVMHFCIFFFKSKLTEVGTAVALFFTQSVCNLCCNHCFVRIHPKKCQTVIPQLKESNLNHISSLKILNYFGTE